MSQLQSLSNFSCLGNVSQDSVTESAWQLLDPDLRNSGYAIAVIVSTIFLIGVPWNLFVICTIVAKKLYSNPTILLLLNLAISNVLLCLLFMPFNIITGFSGEFLIGSTDAERCRVCQAGIVLTILSVMSVASLSLMSVERFIYLNKPLTYSMWVTSKRMLVCIIFIWVLSILSALPPLFKFGEMRFTYSIFACAARTDGKTHVAPNYFYWIFLITELFLLVSVFMVMYISIVLIARKSLLDHLRRSEIFSPDAENCETTDEVSSATNSFNRLRKSQLRLVQIFVAISTTYILTCLPTLVSVIVGIVFGDSSILSPLYVFAYTSFLSVAVIYPILAVCLIGEMRKTMSGCLGYCWKKLRQKPRL